MQSVRLAFQDTMAEPFRQAVAEITGRHVIGFTSQVSADPDMATEAFVLEPDGHEGKPPPVDPPASTS